MLTAADYFDLETTALVGLFADTEYVWEAVARIGPWIECRFAEGLQLGHEGARVAEGQESSPQMGRHWKPSRASRRSAP